MRGFGRSIPGVLLALAICVPAFADSQDEPPPPSPSGAFGEDEADLAARLVINSLGLAPDDPSNAHDDDPRAAALGERLFNDPRLSRNGAVSCASCHDAAREFQDGLPLGQGIGVANRRTMPLEGVAWNTWFFWDGRKDSLWSQALAPLENPVEHGADRTALVQVMAADYARDYVAVFGPFPDWGDLPRHAGPLGDATAIAQWQAMPEADQRAVNEVFANIGKAIAAYERGLVPKGSRLDRYLRVEFGGIEGAKGALTADEEHGLEIFAGKGRCISCHQGPRLTDGFFHNTGVPSVAGLPADAGRLAALDQIEADPFNCLGPFSDAPAEACGELRFLLRDPKALARAFKTPSLRGVGRRAPYMHAGQFATLDEVVRHYDAAPAAEAGQTELKPIRLDEQEIKALVAFLEVL